jgi:hypothetical protein
MEGYLCLIVPDISVEDDNHVVSVCTDLTTSKPGNSYSKLYSSLIIISKSLGALNRSFS